MRIDLLSLLGVIVGFGAILLGQVLEGASVGSLAQLAAFLIVLGGTLGAVMLQYAPRVFWQGLKMTGWVFVTPSQNLRALSDEMVSFSQMARRGGLLALESRIEIHPDAFMRKGLQMLVDGIEPLVLRTTLEIDIEEFEDRSRKSAGVWESAGGYSPTIGILGAVLGLIHVMENLSDPSKLGAGIAVAFVATLYGVGLANLLFLPIAGKLKYIIQLETTRREMLVEGICSIANGENPRIIESKLRSYLPP